MSRPCNFKQIDGGWQCQECGHVHSRPSHRPPVRKCGSMKAQLVARPKRKPRPMTRPTTSLYKEVSPPPVILLGDHVKNALKKVGISEERVTKWLGRPCGCAKRRQKLNDLDVWVRNILSGQTEGGTKELDEVLGD